jgi:hypothetical protein
VLAAVAALAVATAVLSGCGATPQKPAGPTDAEIAAYHEAVREGTWQAARLAKTGRTPPVPVEAIEVPVELWDEAIRECMADAGVDEFEYYSTGSPEDGYTLLDRSGQAFTSRKARLAWYGCIATIQYDPVAFGELVSEAQLVYIYDYFVRWTIPCLTLHGQTVTMPPRDAFVADSQYRWWSPMWNVQVDTEEEYAALLDACGPESPRL